ncbi:MAG: alpha/beta hydrolase [Bacteroidales bacterium]|nr:alpha/beta hydrolase [Bacteroidales bacterium]
MIKSINYLQGNIGYYDRGEGDVIILLHGYLESSEVWENFIPGLAESFRVISIDLPGHGRSGLFGDNHSMDFMADTVMAVMNNEGIEKAMLIGHSMGGYVSLAFIEKYPSRIYAYCLFHSHPFADTDEIIANRKREKRVVESGKKDVIYPVNIPRMFADCNTEKYYKEMEHHKEIASEISADGIIVALNGMISRPSRIKVLEKGDVPLLMILGKHDNYIPFGEVRDNIKLPFNAEIIVLEKSGHLGFVEEKEKSQEAVISFYNKHLK